jgi:hypothetical protein
VDENAVTPADYTVMVKNIPKNASKDYIKDITERFKTCTPGSNW